MPGPRDLSQRTRPVRLLEWQNGQTSRLDDNLVAEAPLQICLGELPLTVTLRTPGHDLELAAGFLFTEGVIRSRDEILSIEHWPRASQQRRKIGRLAGPGGLAGDEDLGDSVRVELAASAKQRIERVKRNFASTASCGVCGKASIESVCLQGIRPPNAEFRIEPEILIQMAEKMRGAQAVFDRTGGLHAAALFDARGGLVALREDIGRHNAVDQVVGWAVLEGKVPLSGCAMMVSGRGGFELVQKAAVAGTPVMVSVSAPSSLAVALARELNLTLVGFLRGSRFIIYSGPERLGLSRAAEPA